MKSLLGRGAPALLALSLITGVAAARAPSERQVDAQASAQAELARAGYSAPRLLRLGRAQLAAGETGAAIASFERGRLLAPRDAGLNSALADARTLAGVAAPEPGPVERAAYLLSLREWSLLAIALAACTAFTLIALVLSRRRARWAMALAASLLALGLAAGGILTTRAVLARAIVVRSDVHLQRSPIPGAESLRTVSEGELVRLTPQRHAGFVYVELPGGGEGWLVRSALAPLAAPAPAGA